jgi:hypothetical protein
VRRHTEPFGRPGRYMVCDWLDGGASHTSAAHSFWMHSPKLTYDDAAEFVSIADD